MAFLTGFFGPERWDYGDDCETEKPDRDQKLDLEFRPTRQSSGTCGVGRFSADRC